MIPSQSPDRSIPLVAFSGQGSDMTILVDKHNPQNGQCRLPRIAASDGCSIEDQASRFFSKQGSTSARTNCHLVHQESGSGGSDGPSYAVCHIPDHGSGNGQGTWTALAGIHRFADRDGKAVCAALAQFWSHMPTANPQFKGIQPYGGGPASDHVIFFGGTFNPWHRAHRACIELCPNPERIVVVPDTNPRKPITHVACPWQEFQQLLEETGNLGPSVFPGYAGLDRPNPTSSWLPKTTYVRRDLLMGDDSWVTLPAWIESERLVKALCAIWVAPRRSSETAIGLSREWLSRVAPECEVHFLGDHPYRDLSSTAIRQSQT